MFKTNWKGGDLGHAVEHNASGAWLNRHLDVCDFGAAGNGATDDTVAIQRAIDAGGVIYFPPGNYSTTTLTLRDDLVIIGATCHGSRLVARGTSPLNLLSAPSRISRVMIRDLGLIGNGEWTQEAGVGAAIYSYTFDGLEVSNCYFEGWPIGPFYGAIPDAVLSEHLTFRGNHCYGGPSNVSMVGVGLFHATGVTIVDNLFERISRPVSFELSNDDSIEQFTVAGNTFRNGDSSTFGATNSGVAVQLTANARAIIRHGVVANNLFINNATGTSAIGFDVCLARYQVAVLNGINISNNISMGYNAEGRPAGQNPPCIFSLVGAGDLVVSGNNLLDPVSDGTIGIRVEDCGRSVFTSNRVSGANVVTPILEIATKELDNLYTGNAAVVVLDNPDVSKSTRSGNGTVNLN